MTWAEEMLERATSSDRWSRARREAEDAWALIWWPPEPEPEYRVHTVIIERRKRRRIAEWRQAA